MNLYMKSKINAVKAANYIFITVCIFVLVFLGICVYAFPHEDFSEEENRALSKFPNFSWDTFTDGSYFKRISVFYSDAIPFRKVMIRTKAMCELGLGKGQNNGVLFLENGRLADRCEYENVDLLKSNLEYLSSFSLKSNTVYAVVPRSVDVYADFESSKRVLAEVSSCFPNAEILYKGLCKTSEGGAEIYYKTDHHLSCDGAFYLYENIMYSLNATPYKAEDFEMVNVSTDFLGSAYSSSGLLPVSYDTITLMRYEGDEDFCIKCEDCSLDSLYCFENLNIKDKYRIFTDGNHGTLHIEGAGENRERLFIVKDSFANAVIPLLARHFDLTVTDPRYTEICVPDDVAATIVIMGADTLASTDIKK